MLTRPLIEAISPLVVSTIRAAFGRVLTRPLIEAAAGSSAWSAIMEAFGRVLTRPLIEASVGIPPAGRCDPRLAEC